MMNARFGATADVAADPRYTIEQGQAVETYLKVAGCELGPSLFPWRSRPGQPGSARSKREHIKRFGQ